MSVSPWLAAEALYTGCLGARGGGGNNVIALAVEPARYCSPRRPTDWGGIFVRRWYRGLMIGASVNRKLNQGRYPKRFIPSVCWLNGILTLPAKWCIALAVEIGR